MKNNWLVALLELSNTCEKHILTHILSVRMLFVLKSV